MTAAIARAEARATRLAAAIEHGDEDVEALVSRRRAARADADAARAELARLPPLAPIVGLDIERELVSLAADIRGAVMEGYDRAAAGDLEVMRALRAVLRQAIREPLRARQEGDRGELTITGTLYPGGCISVSGTRRGSGRDPLYEWAVPVRAARSSK